MERSEKVTSPPPSQPPLLLSPPPSHHHDTRAKQFASDFTALYHSIFPPKPSPFSFSLTPSTSTNNTSPTSSSATAAASSDDILTEHRLHQARLVLEYQELSDHYELCLARLRTLKEELELLRQENADLRLANSELVRLLSLSSKSTIHNHFSNRRGSFESELNRCDQKRNNVERVAFPKSISVRSHAYHKVNQVCSSHGGQSSNSAPNKLPSQLMSESLSVQRQVYLAEGGRVNNTIMSKEEEDKAAMEMELYNQGMWKTELCNKWQETGTCPYGDNCQFAHGIAELRPIIRHPRYKTQVCRMVLAGDVCPYAHRCHFRHSLTEQEKLLLMGTR